MEWKNQIEQNKVSFFKDLQSLIQIQSLRNDEEKTQNAPFGKGCREALDFMLALGKKEGFDVQDIDGYAGVISYGNQSESIGILGHLDVVPAGDGWDSDPFDLIEKDGILFGRGVLDDKGPGLAAFYALKMIKDLNIKLNKKIMLIYGCDEESKMECMKYYLKHGEIPNMGFVPDADFPVIYGEKGILNLKVSVPLTKVIPCNLQAGERFNVVIGGACATCRDFTDEMLALFHFYLQTNQLKGEVTVCDQEAKLQIEGVFAHAATPYLGENAGLHMINFLSNVYENPELKALYANFKDWQGQPLDIFMDSTHMGFLTLNVGKIDLQTDHIDLYLDIRYPHECEIQQMLSKIQSKVQKYCKHASIEIVENSSPLFVDPKSELITTLMDVYQTFSGDYTSVPKTMGGGTYARKLPNFVAFGPEFPTSIKNDKIGNPHQKNEGVVFDDLLKSIAIYAESIKRLGS